MDGAGFVAGQSFDLAVGAGGRRAVVMMGKSREKMRRHKRRMKKPAYQLDKGLLKLELMFEERKPFVAYAILDYVRTRAHTPELDEYKGMMDGFNEVGTAGDMEAVVEEMQIRRMEMDQECWLIMLRAYGARGMLESMRETYDRILSFDEPVDPEVFRVMMRAYGASKDVEGAKWVYKEMRRCNTPVGAETFEVKMELQLLRGDLEGVEDTFFEMTESYGFSPSENGIEVRMEALAANRDLVALEEVFLEVKTFFVPYSTRMFAALISGYLGAGEEERALFQYERMKEEYDLAPSVSLLTTLFDAFRARQDVDGVETVVRDTRAFFISPPPEHLFDALIDFYARDVPSMERLEYALKRKLQTDLPLNRTNADSLLSFLAPANANEPENPIEAAELVDLISNAFREGNSYSSYTIAFEMFTTWRSWKQARRCLTMMEKAGLPPTPSLFNTVIRLRCEWAAESSPELIFEVLDQLKESKCWISRRTLDSMIRVFTRLRSTEALAALFGKMIERDFLPRYHTLQWVYQQEWRDPVVLASINMNTGHRIPYFDPASELDYTQPLQKDFVWPKVRKARKGRQKRAEVTGMDLDKIVEEDDEVIPFFADKEKLYRFLRQCINDEEKREGARAV